MSENNTRGSYVIAKSVAAACRGIETHEQCYYETCRRVLFFFFRTESIRVDDVLGDVENNGKRTKPRERHAQYDVTNGVSVGSAFVTTTTRKHVCTGRTPSPSQSLWRVHCFRRTGKTRTPPRRRKGKGTVEETRRFGIRGRRYRGKPCPYATTRRADDERRWRLLFTLRTTTRSRHGVSA